jgi:hypothetical protein
MTRLNLNRMRVAILILFVVMFFVVPQKLKLTGNMYFVGPYVLLVIVYFYFDYFEKKKSLKKGSAPIMNTTHNNNSKTTQMVGLFIILASSTALFFTNRWEVGFSTFLQYKLLFNAMNITVRNLVLCALNIGTAIVIKADEKNIDERGAAIKNYVSKHTLWFTAGFALIMGLSLKTNSSLLIYAAIVQGYYLILFKVCMYRDSALVYMDDAQAKIFSKKMAKFFPIVGFIQAIILAGLVRYSITQHNPDPLILFILISSVIYSMAQVIYIHWKS